MMIKTFWIATERWYEGVHTPSTLSPLPPASIPTILVALSTT
jgi:hypothetical protein